MQPVVMARDRVARFYQNRIVAWMLDVLDSRGVDLNMINRTFDGTKFDDDYQQLMQLIGYSVSGYGDLRRIDREVVRRANAAVAKLSPRRWPRRPAKRRR